MVQRKKKKSAWNTDEMSQDDMRKREEAKKENYGGGGTRGKGIFVEDTKMYTPKEGECGVRIIRPHEFQDLKYYGFDIIFHTNVGSNNDWYLCSKRMTNFANEYKYQELIDDFIQDSRCPKCEMQTSELWESDRDEAKSCYPQHRILFWILDLMADDEDQGEILLWSCPKSLADEILGQSHKKGTDVYIDVSHPLTGRAVYFDRIGKTKTDTKYKSVQVSEDEMPLPEELATELLCFTEIINFPTYEEMEESLDVKTDTNVKSDDAPPKEEDTQKEPEEKLECFGKEHDQWEDCDECSNAKECEAEQFGKKEKKARKPKFAKEDKKDDDRSDEVLEDSEGVKEKLRAAINKRNKK